MIAKLKNIGPGALVAAAFIGPGTVTVCTLTGFNSGYSLLWVIVLAIITTISFQEMAARVGLCTPWGLSEAILQRNSHWLGRAFAILLIVSAIFIGNAMYEAGNISGALLGVGAMMPPGYRPGLLMHLLITAIAFAVLISGRYQLIERTLIVTVGLMAVAFLAAAIVAKPDILAILRGLTVPSLPDGNLLYAVGLIGTTVVPYNLFLHASTVKEKWNGVKGLQAARWDTYIAVGVGGLISMAIIITASAATPMIETLSNAADLSRILEPSFGKASRYAVAIGLFAAGLSSSITAPLGAAYAISGLFKNSPSVYRLTWMTILLSGLFFSMTDTSPVIIIQYAQVTNGLLLPIIAVFLILTVNNRTVMGTFTNNKWQNTLAIGVLLITLLMAYRTIVQLL